MNLDQLIDSHIESFNSFARINIKTFSGDGNTSFNFYFMWENENDSLAFVNVDTFFFLTGSCDVWAATGFLSGDRTTLGVFASLAPVGWWNQPPTYAPPERSSLQTFGFTADGGGFWDDQAHDGKSFQSTPFDLSYRFFAVPARSTAIFEVSLIFLWGFSNGSGDISDEVSVDFSNADLGNRVLCPFVQLEVALPGT